MKPWPEAYACAPRLEARSGRLTIRPIHWDDRELIRQWRNEQIDVLRQSAELSAADQDAYFADVVRPQMSEPRPRQVLVAMEESGQLIAYGGLVHIDWEDQRAEVSFLSDTRRTSPSGLSEDWAAFLPLIIDAARDHLGLHRLTTECYAFRHDVIGCLEGAGFIEEGRLREHHRHDGGWIDSVLHGLILSPTRSSARLAPHTDVSVAVRPADVGDSDRLLRWRNDGLTRAASRNNGVIALDQHRRWLDDVLADPRRLLLIGEVGESEPMGTARFDAVDERGNYEVSITVAPEWRGQGLSLPLLLAAEDRAARELGPIRIWANVDPENMRSLHLFEAGGYTGPALQPPGEGYWLAKTMDGAR